METFILFGIRCADLDSMDDNKKMAMMWEMAQLLETIFDAELQLRESWHWGYYYCLGTFEDYLYLRENIHPAEDYELLEPDFAEYPFLLYLNGAYKYPHCLAAIEAKPDVFEKLRSEQC